MLMDKSEACRLDEKAENLVSTATQEGAKVDFRAVRVRLHLARKYGSRYIFDDAFGYLEQGIAEARRRKIRPSPRVTVFGKIGNLFKFF